MAGIELIRIIWINMMQNKFKVLLTSLGIIVGTTTIVLVIAIGQGAEKKAAEQFSGLSADTIYVNIDYSKMDANFNAKSLEKLDEVLMNHILDENHYLKNIYLRADTYNEVTINRKKEFLSVTGVTNNYSIISNLRMNVGNDFSEEDFEEERKVVVIGMEIAEKYFSNADNAINQKIQIGSSRYTVIGVLAKNEEGIQGINHNKAIYAPYSTLMKEKVIDEFTLANYIGKVDNIKNVKKAIKEINSTLDYYMYDRSYYKIEDAGSRIETATKSATTMKLLLLSVSIITLIVGGIGIMNILFVTIKERTKEIGILKALGSKRIDILLQFLLESITIGCFSGVVGIILSEIALFMMKYTQIDVVSSLTGKLIAFLFAVLTTAIFGFYPAYKGSLLRPVEALNQE